MHVRRRSGDELDRQLQLARYGNVTGTWRVDNAYVRAAELKDRHR